MNALPDRLLIVTDRHQASLPLPILIADVLAAGAKWIWLRDRDLAPPDRALLAERLASICRRAGAALTIGADIELAEQVSAAGVHLADGSLVGAARQRLGKKAVLGVSAHSLDDVRRATEAGADYACLSPVFATASKPGYGPELGTAALKDAAKRGIPIVALGGVTAARVPDCMASGASAVAVMGEIMRAPAPAEIVAGLHAALHANVNPAAAEAIGRPAS